MVLEVKKMINALLVDDEQIICQGLRTTIPWEDYSVRIVGEAYNGKEALEKIKEHGNIDLVLIDVMMPEMDGLELAEHLHRLENGPRIIMISGYDEFQYAKRALRLGVKDYLLKPVNIDEMLEIVQLLVKEIKQDWARTRKYEELLLMNSIKQLINGNMKTNIPREISGITIYPFFSSLRNYHGFMRTKTSEEVKIYEKNWKSNINNLLRNSGMECVSFFVEKNMLFTVVYKWNTEPIPRDFSALFNKLSIEGDFYFVFGEATLIRDFKSQHSIMQNAFKYATITGKKYYFNHDMDYMANKLDYSPGIQLKKIKEAFFSSKKEKMFTLIDKLFRDFKQSGLLLEEVSDHCRKTMRMIMEYYQKIMPYNNLETITLNFPKESFDMNEFNSYQLLAEFFIKDMNTLYDFISGEKKEDNWQIIRILEYINEFYNQDIKASEVADYINISPNYFSTFFKQKTGMSFNEYLNKIRIEKAMILLRETSDQVNIIAENVGYHEYKYFAQVFKNISNLTPTEYRNIQL